jgi:hypothetical protein
MLLAPLRPAHPLATAFPATTRPLAALAAAIGILATCLVPGLRGGELTGLSVPFWLIAAPLINIAWLNRSRRPALLNGLRAVTKARRTTDHRRVRQA